MKKVEADVAVIAAGPAGLAACIAAREADLDVVVFEKANVAGGTGNMGMGPFGVESRLQKASMVTLKKEEAFRRFMDYVKWQADAQLIHDYMWRSGDTINWLEDMGVEFHGVEKNFPMSEQTWHVVKPEGGQKPGPRAAGAMFKRMYEHAVEMGVNFYFDTPAYELIKENDEIVGFKAKNESGEEYEVRAKAVIIATGGFGANSEMIKEYTGYDYGKDIFSFQIPGVVGDGIKMAWAVGAGRSRMEMERTDGQPLPGAGTGQYPQVNVFRQSSCMAVNKSGFRICDESVMQNASVAGNIIDYQQDRTVYKITSRAVLRHLKKDGLDNPSGVFRVDPTVNFDEAWTELAGQFPDICFVAETPEELAENMGVDVKNFVQAVERYNELCEQNYDDDFCKDRNFMHPMSGKLYAYRVSCGGYGSLGGIKINHRYEVITEDYQVIPGLYAAGTDVCDIYNGTYYYYLPGNTMGFAINSGRIAGENAAARVLGEDE